MKWDLMVRVKEVSGEVEVDYPLITGAIVRFEDDDPTGRRSKSALQFAMDIVQVPKTKDGESVPHDVLVSIAPAGEDLE